MMAKFVIYDASFAPNPVAARPFEASQTRITKRMEVT
jgi:hypothetical protein